MEKPIIFKCDMIRAILDGKKTMTRRLIKVQPKGNRPVLKQLIESSDKERNRYKGYNYWESSLGDEWEFFKPPYQIGDKLWVREPFGMVWKNDYCVAMENIEPEAIKCIDCDECDVEYKADTNNPYPGEWPPEEAKGSNIAPKWRPSIHMPKRYARIWLEVTNIKAEKIQDITEGDIIKEGIRKVTKDGKVFRSLWESIYPCSWESNDWVWCYEFKVISKDGKKDEESTK